MNQEVTNGRFDDQELSSLEEWVRQYLYEWEDSDVLYSDAAKAICKTAIIYMTKAEGNRVDCTKDIQVTDEMVEAGLKELEESGRLIGSPWGSLCSSDGILVRRLFLAMWDRRPFCHESPH